QLWTKNGLLRAWRTAGGHRRIARSSVEEILSQKRAVSGSEKQHRLSVVIVEDDKKQLRMYEKFLITLFGDVDIVTAHDGYEGLFKIGYTSPDIIITDLKMPLMDGFQMINALQRQPELANCSIIVISALTEEEIKVRGGLPQRIKVITKPVLFDELDRLIQNKLQLQEV
ncbi:MAG: response regulator, partial [Gammaproteobacteria bacterium]|nr:response regulator [Gammaproteobacteria bacterium]